MNLDAPSAFGEMTPEERNWAMACHLSVLSGLVVPLGSVLGPLVVWLIKRGESQAVDRHGRAALNFQLTMALAVVVGLILPFVGAMVPGFGCFVVAIGWVAVICCMLASLLVPIWAAVNASKGNDYLYPLSLRFLR